MEESRKAHGNRPRLRDKRAEEVLVGVERGSYRHTIELSIKEPWSTATKDSIIILRTVLEILAEETVPDRPVWKGTDVREAVEDTMPLRRLTALVRLLMRAITDEAERLNTRSQHMFSEVFEEYLDTVGRWFGFYMQAGLWKYAFNPHQSGDAPLIVADFVYGLYYSGSQQLKTAMHASDSMIDLIMALWVSQDKNGAYHQQVEGVKLALRCPFVALFICFCSNHTSTPIIGTKIACLPKRKRQRILEGSISRMNGWRERQLQKLQPNPLRHLYHIITSTNQLLDVAGPQYRKDYFALQFSTFALDLCKQFNATNTPIQIEVACSFISAAYKNTVDVGRRLILELLQDGLLHVVVASLLSQAHDSPERWKQWYPLGDAGITPTPLELLVTLSVEKGVCIAASSAIDLIEARDIRMLRSSWAKAYWEPFANTIALYKLAWGEIPANGIIMCDNAIHDHGTTVREGEARECGSCRTRVYCSRRCQTQDWETVHRDECHSARAARIECEINHTWVSHRLRSFLFVLTQHYLLNFEAGLPIDWYDMHCTVPNQWGGCIVFPVRMPIMDAASLSDVTRTLTLVFGTAVNPAVYLPMPVDQVLQLRHEGRLLFHEPRYVDILEEFRNVSSNEGFMLPGECDGNDGVSKVWRVAMLSVRLGEHLAFFIGRYVVEKASNMTRVRRLNGYVKVC